MNVGWGWTRGLLGALLMGALACGAGCDDPGAGVGVGDAGFDGDSPPGPFDAGADSGPPDPPPYRAEPLSCQGTAPTCSTYDASRAACDAVRGCNYGRCEYRELACLAFERYNCESGCAWDSYLERCERVING